MRAKKYTSLVLAIIMSVSLVACGSNAQTESKPKEEVKTESSQTETENQTDTSEVSYGVGDTITSDYLEMTLKSVEFVDGVNRKANDSNFMTPITEEEAKELGNNNFALAAEGKTLLLFTFEYKYIGKDSKSLNGIGQPFVTYGDDYKFNSMYFVGVKKAENNWLCLSSDNNTGFTEASSHYEPLDSTIYECKGYIVVPKEVAENQDSSLKISFGFGGEFTIR